MFAMCIDILSQINVSLCPTADESDLFILAVDRVWMSKINRENLSSEFAIALWFWRAQVLEKFKVLLGHCFVATF